MGFLTICRLKWWELDTIMAILILAGFVAIVNQPLDQTRQNLTPFFEKGFAGLIQAMGYTFIALQGFDLTEQLREDITVSLRPEGSLDWSGLQA